MKYTVLIIVLITFPFALHAKEKKVDKKLCLDSSVKNSEAYCKAFCFDESVTERELYCEHIAFKIIRESVPKTSISLDDTLEMQRDSSKDYPLRTLDCNALITIIYFSAGNLFCQIIIFPNLTKMPIRLKMKRQKKYLKILILKRQWSGDVKLRALAKH